MTAAEETADVVVVGGGPVGLMLAAELRLSGVDPVVLERLPAVSEIPKGNGLFGMIVPVLDYRGLLDRFRAGATYAGPVPQFQFGPLQLDFSRLNESPLHVLAIPQRRLETLLGERLAELGGNVRRGHELLALSVSEGEQNATLEVNGPDGAYRIAARFLVGCDGAHSPVRKQAGIGFPGVTSTEIGRLGRVVLPTATVAPGGGAAEVPGLGRLKLMQLTQTPTGAYSLAPAAALDRRAPPGMFIVYTKEEADSAPAEGDADAPLTLDELRDSARRVFGAELPMTDPLWLSRTVGNSRQADRYRAGPVLLAGDAAHIFGAGGSLNAGLLDALNLGWKLAAQIRGWAPDGLLDSYQAERYPAGQRMILQSRASRALAARGEYSDALRELVGQLLSYPDAVRHVGAMIEGSDVRYETPAGGAPPHRLAGWLAPDLRVETSEGRTRVAELTRGARGLLLDFTADAAVAPAAAGWAERVSVLTARCLTSPAPAAAMLIRPDGYVAWAAGPDTKDLVRGPDEALRTWFGQP
jgi:2-polyprenyl-6-methoxyphenol hydroxylase-like FAD-dependent oxidoreductase